MNANRLLKSRDFAGFIIVLATLIVAMSGPACAGQADLLVYFDGHMHTIRSDGSGNVSDIKATALSRGLSAVIVTDHCPQLTKEEWDSLIAETAAVSDETFLALPGFEITGSDGLLNRTHVLAWGVNSPFVDPDAELSPDEIWISPPNPAGTGPVYPENITKWVDYIHSKGGIAIHNHTTGSTRLDYGVNCIELYNQSHVEDVISYANMLGIFGQEAWQFGMTLNNFAIYGERDANMIVALPGFPPMPLRNALYYATQGFTGVGQWVGAPEAPLNSWDDLLMAYVNGEIDHPIFGMADSDAHNTGASDSNVGIAKNGLYVKALTPKEFYKAVKAGRSFATTGPSLNFEVNGEKMGDTAFITKGAAVLDMSVNSDDSAALLVKIEIYKNGQSWKTFSPMAPACENTIFDEEVSANGYYRIEVTAFNTINAEYTFAWSNPVFIETD